VEKALKMFKIRYPVALDNNYATWNAYNNHYWPAHYLIDASGRIRKIHFGEGDYEGMENAIRTLIEEIGQNKVEPSPKVADTTPKNSQTPEIYLGLNRLNPPGAAHLGLNKFGLTSNPKPDSFHFYGTWNLQPEYAEAVKDASIRLNFEALQVYLVIWPNLSEDVTEVLLDGKLIPKKFSGKDLLNSHVLFNDPRLYHLVDLHGNRNQHILQLNFKTPGTRSYAFTFG